MDEIEKVVDEVLKKWSWTPEFGLGPEGIKLRYLIVEAITQQVKAAEGRKDEEIERLKKELDQGEYWKHTPKADQEHDVTIALFQKYLDMPEGNLEQLCRKAMGLRERLAENDAQIKELMDGVLESNKVLDEANVEREHVDWEGSIQHVKEWPVWKRIEIMNNLLIKQKDAELAKVMAELKDLKQSIQCENMDPNGTIWDHADKVQKENVHLKGELAEVKADLQEIRTYCTLTYGESHPEIKKCPHEMELAKLQEVVSKIQEGLETYGEHDKECIRSQCQAGHPTSDGGYENLYGYGDKEKWYRTHPVDESPKCECGFDKACTHYKNYQENKTQCRAHSI